MKFSEEQIMDRTDEIREDMHAKIDAVFSKSDPAKRSNPGFYQDITNVVLMRYIAELQLRLEVLERRDEMKILG